MFYETVQESEKKRMKMKKKIKMTFGKDGSWMKHQAGTIKLMFP